MSVAITKPEAFGSIHARANFQDSGSSCQRSQRQNKRGLYQVSFDDRIVVVNGDTASTVEDTGPMPVIDQEERTNLLQRLKTLLQRMLGRQSDTSNGPEFDAADTLELKCDTCCPTAGGSNGTTAQAPVGEFSLPRATLGCDFSKSYFDVPTVCDRLKINPLYEDNAKTADALSRSLEHYYCDVAPVADRQWSQEGLVIDEEPVCVLGGNPDRHTYPCSLF